MSIVQPPQDYKVLFLDMNSFFASVEQQVHPELRGKAVGVTPYTGSSGCIIAASYEAKQVGVKTGTKVGEAKRIFPQINIIEAKPALYMVYHKEIKKVVESVTPYYRPLSIDEFMITLTPRERNAAAAESMARQIKEGIRAKVGDYLKCSVGVGPNYFLAKMAAESKKPDGFTVVELCELENFYSGLRLRDLVGINSRLEAYLVQSGIITPLQLFEASLPELRSRLNHWGRLWYFRLRGYEIDEYVSTSKTIGHSHVLAPEFRTKEGALSVADKLIYKASYRLRKEGYMAQGVSVSLHFVDRGSFHRSKKVASFDDNRSFKEGAFSLLSFCRWQSRPIYVAVSAFNLVRASGRQLSFFPDIERSKNVSEAIDEVNDYFGAGSIYPASMMEARDSAPDRIPFGKPRYDIIND
ncbi:MAG: DNA polymerase IV [bacterium ADurb.Bin400]|nr:MAG: DNA polymerase IV [bacterium ADurb.Bin400]